MPNQERSRLLWVEVQSVHFKPLIAVGLHNCPPCSLSWHFKFDFDLSTKQKWRELFFNLHQHRTRQQIKSIGTRQRYKINNKHQMRCDWSAQHLLFLFSFPQYRAKGVINLGSAIISSIKGLNVITSSNYLNP